MYENFYGLKTRAFNLIPDPEFLFLNKRSKEALEHILYGIDRREGFAILMGDVGTGKTTLCWALLDRLSKRRDVRTALVQNPMLSERDILKSILQDLGVRPKVAVEDSGPAAMFDSSWMAGMSKKELIDCLNIFLAERAMEDAFTVLIIDEAQNLSLEMLEQLRLLSNLETSKTKLLQIIFVGQLELDQKLKLPALRQLNQRISIRFETKALNRDDTRKYVERRLIVAGGAPKLRFTRGAWRSIYAYSKGYPRLINLICDRALLAGYSERSLVITRGMVRKAVRNLEGKEAAIIPWLPESVPKIVPIVASVILILLLLSLLVWKVFLPQKVQTLQTPTQLQFAAFAAAAEEKPSEAKPVTAAAPPPRQGYSLQVHSLRSQGEAEAAATGLSNSGYDARVERLGKWFVVFVGPFPDLGKAREVRKELKSKGLSPVIR